MPIRARVLLLLCLSSSFFSTALFFSGRVQENDASKPSALPSVYVLKWNLPLKIQSKVKNSSESQSPDPASSLPDLREEHQSPVKMSTQIHHWWQEAFVQPATHWEEFFPTHSSKRSSGQQNMWEDNNFLGKVFLITVGGSIHALSSSVKDPISKTGWIS